MRSPASRRHDRPPTDAQRDERFKVDVDPEEGLRRLLGMKPEDSSESGPDQP